MKAVHSPKSGPADIMYIVNRPKPEPQAGELLVAVRSATVTSGDVQMRRLPRRLLTVVGALAGFKPMETPGTEFAGDVEAVGPGVTAFSVGDAVCGTTTGLRHGANAEWVVVPAAPKHGVVQRKPEELSYDQAVACIVGGMTAMQLLKKAGAGEGDHVLIYGASGHVGSSALQLATHFGCHVTGVCSTANVELVRSLGAEYVIDYTAESITDRDGRYDLILDAVGKLPKSRCKSVLADGGRYTSIRRLTKETADELAYVQNLAATGVFTPVIDREFALDEIVGAHRYVESGRKRGTVIVRVSG